MRIMVMTGNTVAFTLVLAGMAFGQAEDARSEFLARYEPHARELEERYSRIRFRTVWKQSGDKEDRWQRVQGMFDFDHYLAKPDRQGKAGEAGKGKDPTIDVRNPRYEFTVREKPDGKYALARTALFPEPKERPEIQRHWLNFPYSVPHWGKTFLELAKDPSTRVESAREVEWRGQHVYEVVMSCTFFHRGEKKEKRSTIKFYFLPSAKWVCVGFVGVHLHVTDPVIEHVYKYETTGAWAVPIKHELWERIPGTPEQKLLREVDILEFAPATDWDESRFRLSAFGLPEPAGVEWPRPTPRWAWLLAAAGALAVMAVGLAWLARQRWRAQAA
jgi:hypothetical protein